ncbi:hypothetical protein GCM10027022_03530 [Alpinimonas psychrophila]|uniref:DNA-binding XRE family transcriptional regulator n=1 Tax=Alpinimonas psychrophila TaxID=748908 RepID=A0A7W3PN99_9MICO|nr:DNA-binding XRE family transcriptional regulator [Alpinimonas psychrophila]
MSFYAHFAEQHLSAIRLEMSIQRNLRGLTYDDLAKSSGVSRRTLVAIEGGTSRGSVETWMRICAAFGTTFSQFLEDSAAAHVVTLDVPLIGKPAEPVAGTMQSAEL